MKRRKRYIRLPRTQRRLVSVLLGGYVTLVVNSLLLYLFERSTALLYMSNVLLHIALGTVLVLPALVFLSLHLSKMPIRLNWKATGAGAFTASSLALLLATGFGLVFLGASQFGGWILRVHVISVFTTVLGFALHVSLKQGLRYRFLEWGQSWKAGWQRALRHPLTITLAAGLALSFLVVAAPWLSDDRAAYVESVKGDPLSGAQAILAQTAYLDDADLARSVSCGQQGCHPDITDQWNDSAHRFSSFNNPWYRKSVEAMVERSGNDPARWCASCHDPLVLFTGRFADDVPLDMQHETALAGLTCLSCHAIKGLRDVKGNGRYVMGAPDEYPFARASEGLGKWIHNILVRAKPEPHRDAMLKPMHRTSEFCGTCHKVSLPPNVNNYRWKRGQNEYDAWQSSGTSGNTVRSFYLPKEPLDCADCHMPRVASQDQGNDDGFVRSHRFAAANTALPFLYRHEEQLRLAQDMLGDAASVDVFEVSVGGRRYGPLDAMPVLRPGDDVEVSVVVRNRKTGHLLPGGTNDSNEMWLHLLAEDADGDPVLASGRLDSEGRVDSTAHFWGAVQVDRASRLISRRNAQDWISTVYMNAISPGTAHVVHYRFMVPQGTPIASLTATLKHRKFKWYFNNWAFRGHVPDSENDSLAHLEVDLRRWELNDREAPDIPVTDMAAASRHAGAVAESDHPLWERWNDHAIGLFREGDTRGALIGFEKVAELAPESPEGLVNLARVYLEQGQLDRAAVALDEALRRSPGNLKAAWFRGEILKADGLYEEALKEWAKVYEVYPRDRVLLAGVGRVRYLMGDYQEALRWIDLVLDIDPEDIGALYNRMLTLGALGRSEELEEARDLYAYHKDDEDALAVTALYKRGHPVDNREAQPIHAHGLRR